MTLQRIFARRYALGAFLFVGVALVFAWKYFSVGGDNPLGLARLLALSALLWLPWLIWTALTRLKIAGGNFVWRALPTVTRGTFKDILSVQRISGDSDDIPVVLIEVPGKNGRPRRLRLTPYIFPRSDVHAFLSALRQHRPDLSVPDLI